MKSSTITAVGIDVSKSSSPYLRRTLFTVSGIILQLSHGENPVFCFMDKKRSEGKHFYIYMVAGAAKSYCEDETKRCWLPTGAGLFVLHSKSTLL